MFCKIAKVYLVIIALAICLAICVGAVPSENNVDISVYNSVVQEYTEPMPEQEEIVLDDIIIETQNIEPEYIEVSEPEWNFDFDYVCRVVAAECRGEPYEGQVAVAQCIWNTAVLRGITPFDVVTLPKRYAKPVSENLVTESVRTACKNVFLGIDSVTEEPIEYFYSTENGFVSKWHENDLEHVITIGVHKFFKEVN